MIFHTFPIKGPLRIEFEPRHDERGYFMRTFCARELKDQTIEFRITQINRSRTARRGTLRGMHFQKEPHAEAKIISCLQGKIYDVLVDLREESPTYRKWVSMELAAEKNIALYIPAGFAHGFETLEEECEVEYLMSEFYHPESSSGVRWNDPLLDIVWPITSPTLSDRDANWPLLV
ncbi:MAG: dTDP-4-dehydrorhamnose 3,5-epimerase [Parcubacteria group bacterium Gr01-1014_33]|nr:MAG: dTDP-4-dehydrorhamnose 3,5-epimerase [Parcubacteria group bacterium Gr01-1014_33]